MGTLSYPPALNAASDKVIVKKVKGTWDKGILKIIDRIKVPPTIPGLASLSPLKLPVCRRRRWFPAPGKTLPQH